MPEPKSNARLRADLVALLARIPRGYVAAIGDVSRHLSAYQPHVTQVLAHIDSTEEQPAPWWRVVADGGAVGRHPRREEQMARLREDGIIVSAAGIVQEMTERRVKDLASPPGAPFGRVEERAGELRPARSRGMKRHPQA